MPSLGPEQSPRRPHWGCGVEQSLKLPGASLPCAECGLWLLFVPTVPFVNVIELRRGWPLLSWQQSPTPRSPLPQKTVSTLPCLVGGPWLGGGLLGLLDPKDSCPFPLLWAKSNALICPLRRWGEDCYRFKPPSLVEHWVDQLAFSCWPAWAADGHWPWACGLPCARGTSVPREFPAAFSPGSPERVR